MGTLSSVQDMVGNKTTLAVLDVLLFAQPLTARQIYFRLRKRRGLSISYQAVHKRLLKLLQEGVLNKERLEYTISTGWLDKLDEFISSARKRLHTRERLLLRLQRKEPLFERRNRKIKVVSFDLRGVMCTNQFDELLWRREMPQAYAKQYGILEEEAFERVTGEYRRLWGKVSGWRDPTYWLQHFRLDVSYDQLVKDILKEIQFYPDVEPVIKKLSKEHHLIIVSHAHHTLLGTKIGRLKAKFLKFYSASSDFGKISKDAELYSDVCEALGVAPHEIVHLGSDPDHDYKIPTSVGIHSFLIDRRGVRTEPFVVRDLFDFEKRIEELENLR